MISTGEKLVVACSELPHFFVLLKLWSDDSQYIYPPKGDNLTSFGSVSQIRICAGALVLCATRLPPAGFGAVLVGWAGRPAFVGRSVRFRAGGWRSGLRAVPPEGVVVLSSSQCSHI